MIQKRTWWFWLRPLHGVNALQLDLLCKSAFAETTSSFALMFIQRSFNVESPTSTSIIVMIQKRTTTWFSFQPFNS